MAGTTHHGGSARDPGTRARGANVPWHSLTAEEAMEGRDSGPDGLSPTEAAARLARHGPNRLPSSLGRGPLVRFLAQFHNVLIYFLLCAAVLTWLLDHRVDAAVILAVVVVNAIVGFVQEGRAERALDAIQDVVAPRATVVRGGRRTTVAADALVPGDVVVLEAGDRVPADLRLIDSRSLLIEEAVLTGESVPAEKQPASVPADTLLAERASMAHSGTLVVAGRASGVVVATGADTRIGGISGLVGGVRALVTPLLRQINGFGRAVTLAAAVGGTLLFAFAVLVRDFALVEALVAVVALAVSIIPEGLPAVITITLAIGVRRMAARRALIRRLPAVETLGATSVICSDKTGTLTRNEMTVRRLYLWGRTLTSDGSGHTPVGRFTVHGDPDTPSAPLAAIVETMVLCNDADVHPSPEGWRVVGDPMEAALITAARKAGADPDRIRAAHARPAEIPFDARHRYMAVLSHTPGGGRRIHVKGAPERLLSMCSRQVGDDGTEEPLDTARWEEIIATAAQAGERVIALAHRDVPDDTRVLGAEDVVDGLVLAGLVGLIDPIRDEASAAIARCRTAGITVVMITGDHTGTAAAVARELGIAEAPVVVTGHELDALDDDALADTVEGVNVFARTDPEHKLRIVRALQGRGRIVAMTGDGVNDAPALKQADVGVAMGRRGTEAAKEASDMVLLDDDFASIVAAVNQGRVVHDNIRKVIAWTLPTNGGEVLIVIAAIAVGATLPVSPVQILWLNLVLGVTLGLALAFEPAEDGVMDRPPREPNAALLSRFLLWRVVLVSVLLLVVGVAVFSHALARGHDVATARTLVVNVIVVLKIFYLFDIRYLHASSMRLRAVRGTPAVLLALAVLVPAQFALTYTPFLNEVFGTAPVPFADGVLVVALGALVLPLLEVEKLLVRRFGIFPELRS
ncbi:HAD-IC family P-type ATPase [Nocardiopsis lambiniae]|uniref:HAD-IC family P-type ATPase n=1 Tax=Nocardiopsis lambiniae TaxID=3075539 RepID=A0ABU2M6T3_9ACTN|nr:HAD-IC family P-type ATPase [Nocardiopsis sp. DSM 44743]MDT0328382.1 HAD-IC family P-type ATPase [Nocardiopsis sp. DSM 44743]